MRLLIGLVDGESGAYLFAYAMLLDQTLDVEVRVVQVIEESAAPFGLQARRDATDLVGRAVRLLREREIEASGVVYNGSARQIADVLLGEAERWKAEMIVLNGRRHRDWTTLFTQDVRRQVIRRSSVPTTLVGLPEPATMKRSRNASAADNRTHLRP